MSNETYEWDELEEETQVSIRSERGMPGSLTEKACGCSIDADKRWTLCWHHQFLNDAALKESGRVERDHEVILRSETRHS